MFIKTLTRGRIEMKDKKSSKKHKHNLNQDFKVAWRKEERREFHEVEHELTLLDSKIEIMEKELNELRQAVATCTSSVESSVKQYDLKFTSRLSVWVALLIGVELFSVVTILVGLKYYI
jgi:hypothetical protein